MASAAVVINKQRIAGSLYGMLVGDTLAVPGHWFYSPAKLQEDYGEEISEMMDPKPTHAESMIQGMSYHGSIDILHDKAIYYEGRKSAAAKAQETATATAKTTQEDLQARRDDHGNYVGYTAEERVHYHQSLSKGMNTVNVCIARLLMRYIGKKNQGKQDYYDPDEFLEEFQTYMTTPPHKDDTSQIRSHNDTYLDIYVRHFFTQASQTGRRLRDCAMTQRDQWSIGSLDGVVMAIPIIAAYAKEPESMVLGRVVEHHMLTHRSITVTMVCSVLVPLLLELYHGADLTVTLERAMSKLRPPKCTGREQRDSYVYHQGPGNIPPHEKWLQHMATTDEDFLNLLQGFLSSSSMDDQDVAGWGDRPNSRFSTACYCEQAFAVVLYLCYKYRDDPRKALSQNVMLGGHSTARGAVLGAILGAVHPEDFPWVEDLAAYPFVQTEIHNLIETI
uniref:ADP-ribosylglycohydrolase n=1 Tax=Amphora coffeiformis TaxID=265554 RepID=A0A7S3L414_9STRA|eukprot:scaffold7858_cov132-Amphora_coffeaeformis.AAC.2